MGGEISAARAGESEERRGEGDEDDGVQTLTLQQKGGGGGGAAAAAGIPAYSAAPGETYKQPHAAAAFDATAAAEREIERAGKRRGRRRRKKVVEQPPRGFQVVSRLVWGSVHDCYRISCEILGRGSSGPIYECTSKISCRNFCIKFFNKKGAALSAPAATSGGTGAAAAPPHQNSIVSSPGAAAVASAAKPQRLFLPGAAPGSALAGAATCSSGSSSAAASAAFPAAASGPARASRSRVPRGSAADRPRSTAAPTASPVPFPAAAAAGASEAGAAGAGAAGAAPSSSHATPFTHASPASGTTPAADRAAVAGLRSTYPLPPAGGGAAGAATAIAAAATHAAITKEHLAHARIRNEISVSVRVDHPNVARLIEVFEDENQLFMVTEYCAGGDLYMHLRRCGRFPENEARPIVAQMLLALSYLHAHDIVHRDLRLEKWTFATAAPHAEGATVPAWGAVKLIDLGHAKHWVDKSKKMNAACGTLPYASPDMLVGGYTEACDLWSLGVIVYMLLCGRPPFHGTPDQLIDQILSGRYSTTSPGWENVSPLAIDFVRRLLEVDPERRMTAQEARCHPWVALPRVKHISLPPSFLATLRKFAACTKVKRTILTMVAYSITAEGAAGFDQMFLNLSNPSTGTIQFEDFSSLLKKNYPALDAAEVAEIFEAMDSTRSGELHYNDFLAAMLRVTLEKEEALLIHTFRKCDVDRSGYMSLNDMRVILGDQYTPDGLEQVMRDFDTNGNGRIDLEEFLEAIGQDEEFDSFSTDASACPTMIAASTPRYL